MPLPKPNDDESHDDFISRCHSALADEFDDADQRNAVCEQLWRDRDKDMSKHETKALGSVEVKDADEGLVTARFATLGVKDKDGDVIEPGAFGEQRVKVSSFGHGSWMGELPVGVGTVRETDDEALGDLKFFLETTHGRDHFETIKGLGDLGEWSFGFDVLEESAPDEDQQQLGIVRILKKLKVHEVSPVLQGAGIDTQTLSVKCDDCDAKAAKKDDDGEADPAPDWDEKKGSSEPDDIQETIAVEVGRYEALKATDRL